MTVKMFFSAEVADGEDVRGLCEQIGMHFEKFGDARLLSVSVVKDGESLKVGRGPYKNVMLTDAGYEELVRRLGKGKAEALIADFSYKLYQKGYRFKDHFAAILEWDKEEERGKTPAAAGYTSSVAYGDSFPSRGSLSGDGRGEGEAQSFDVDEFFNAAVKRTAGD